jgi:hypothetical protein
MHGAIFAREVLDARLVHFASVTIQLDLHQPTLLARYEAQARFRIASIRCRLLENRNPFVVARYTMVVSVATPEDSA